MPTTIYGIFWEDYVYVGQTDGDPQLRKRKHYTLLAQRQHHCKFLQQLYMLVPEEFQFKVLEENASVTAEREWIQAFGIKALNTIGHVSNTRVVVREKGEAFQLFDEDGTILFTGKGVRNAMRITGLTRAAVEWRRKPLTGDAV